MINLFLVFRYNVMHQKFWERENIEKKKLQSEKMSTWQKWKLFEKQDVEYVKIIKNIKFYKNQGVKQKISSRNKFLKRI